jgi:hypothetical protein
MVTRKLDAATHPVSESRAASVRERTQEEGCDSFVEPKDPTENGKFNGSTRLPDLGWTKPDEYIDNQTPKQVHRPSPLGPSGLRTELLHVPHQRIRPSWKESDVEKRNKCCCLTKSSQPYSLML